LGIINLRDFNTTLLLKWWWKLYLNPRRRWASLVAHSYRPVTGWWSDRCINNSSSSPLWKEMRGVNDIFFLALAMEVKDGRGMRFWEDKWRSLTPLKNLFPDLYVVA